MPIVEYPYPPFFSFFFLFSLSLQYIQLSNVYYQNPNTCTYNKYFLRKHIVSTSRSCQTARRQVFYIVSVFSFTCKLLEFTDDVVFSQMKNVKLVMNKPGGF